LPISAAAAGLRGAVHRGAVAGGGCAAVVRVGLAAEGAADEHSGGGRYCGVSGDAGGQWHAHEACAQVARGAANQVTSCSAPALRAWEGRALARPQSRGAELPAAPFRTGGGAPTQKSSHRGRCSYAEYIGEARAHRRSIRPGCECQPAVAGLLANPVRTEGGAPTQSISEMPEPTVGAPAPGANASRRRRGCRQPGSHRGAAPTWGMARVYGVQPRGKAWPVTPPLLTLYTWRL